MSYTHRHGAALRRLDQQPPDKMCVSPPAAPPMPEYDYRCAECADDVIGDWFEERGVGRIVCERCGGKVVAMEDL